MVLGLNGGHGLKTKRSCSVDGAIPVADIAADEKCDARTSCQLPTCLMRTSVLIAEKFLEREARGSRGAPEHTMTPVPGVPTLKELYEHSATHLLHVGWCPSCVAAKGQPDHQRRLCVPDGKDIAMTDYVTSMKETSSDTLRSCVHYADRRAVAAIDGECNGGLV